MMPKDFNVGDLVWAKMKGFPSWPSKIADPSSPNAPIKPNKKPQHLVFFFGTEDYAWISDDDIVPHSKKMLESWNNKKKTRNMEKAFNSIMKESRSNLALKKNEKKGNLPTESLESVMNSRKQLPKGHKAIKGSLRKQYFAKAQKISKNKYLANIRKKARKQSAVKITKDINILTVEKASEMVDSQNMDFDGVAVIRSLDSGSSQPVQAKCIKATDKKIGFLGLGTIGQMIVKNLMEFGHNVTIWNRSPEKCVDLAKAGARQALTPADVIANCDITFCCVSGPDAVKAIMFSPDGVINGFERCGVHTKGYVEMTSIDPIISEEISEAIMSRGGKYLEAPITGSRQFAKAGSLLILGAGDYELFNSCESCFFALSTSAYYLSSVVGSGSKMNLLLSAFMGSTYAALAEAMALIERCNLSQSHFLEFLDMGPLRCPVLLSKAQAMISSDFSTHMALRHQQKDLSLALLMGDACDQPMPLTTQANQLFMRAKVMCETDQDVAAVYLGTKY